jgi:SAM-dependent methyltransferase
MFLTLFNTYLAQEGRMLYVGTADVRSLETKPKKEPYELAYPDYIIETCDIDSRWKPDHVMDITQPYEHREHEGAFDLIIMVNTMEHIGNIFDVPAACWFLLKPGGHVIVDSPWNYPYHGAHGYKDFWRISLDGFQHLFQKGFKKIKGIKSDDCISIILQKK